MVIKGFKTVVKPSDDMHELKKLIGKWREPKLIRVRSNDIVPDTSNRSHTGLSVDHVHFIALSMLRNSFCARPPHGKPTKGPRGNLPHDIPVLVRGGPSDLVATQSLAYMRLMCRRDPDFPRVTIREDAGVWFCSLGNGHFSQALNLFRQQLTSKFTDEVFRVPPSDRALAHALAEGISSIVLRMETPVEVRRRVAHLLNTTHEYKWAVDAAGAMDISPNNCCLESGFSQFHAMSKVLDGEALGKLVRTELGILSNGVIPVVGMRVTAVGSSYYGTYLKGHTGFISKLTVGDPIVQWDHNGQALRSDRSKLDGTDSRVQIKHATQPSTSKL